MNERTSRLLPMNNWQAQLVRLFNIPADERRMSPILVATPDETQFCGVGDLNLA